VGDIVIPTDPIAGAATGEVTVTANLDVQTAFVAAPASPPTQADLDAATFTSSTVVYDSLGTAHDVTLAYWATAAGTWSFSAVVDATETGGPAGTFTELASGSLVFDTSGNLDTAASSVTSNPVTFTGAAAQTVAFDFGLATGDEGALTQYDTPTSNVYDVSADGNASGDLGSFDIAADGTVTGVYSNGVTRTLGQVVLAQFRAETGLNRVGHNLYQQSLGSGEPVIGAANAGGRGVVHSYALEMSNVDMEQQFVKMIQSQKGYQASARVVSAVDDMLKELMQVV
jgi:flagellar hook protein FlgE